MFEKIKSKIGSIFRITGSAQTELDYLDEQDLSRFSEQDIILETEDQIQEFLPEVLGQALARTWIDKRFLDAFYNFVHINLDTNRPIHRYRAGTVHRCGCGSAVFACSIPNRSSTLRMYPSTLTSRVLRS